MHLKFLGTGSAFNPAMHNSNAWFGSGNRFYLVDCGESTFARMWNLPAYAGADEVVAIITHLHADHVGSLGSLISYSHYVAGKKVTVAHPLGTIVDYLDLSGIDRACYRFRQLAPGVPNRLDDWVSVTPLEVEHVPDMTCYGYIIEEGGERAYVSGDARNIPEIALRGILDGTIARAYQDTSNRESDHPTHMTLSALEAAIPPDARSRVFAIHLDYDYRDKVRERGFGTVSAD